MSKEWVCQLHHRETVDRESAYEKLASRAAQAHDDTADDKAKSATGTDGNGGSALSSVLGAVFGGGRRESVVEAMAKSAARSIGSQIGRQVLRGVLGSLLGGRRR